MTRAAALVLALLATGCFEGAPIPLDETIAGKTSLVWREDGVGMAYDAAHPPVSLAWPADGPTYVATFTWTLEEMGLEPGPFAPLGTSQTRVPPAPEAVFVVRRGEGDWTLTPAAAVDEALASLRLPPLDDASCLRGGGCRPADGTAVCKTPCPSPDAPAPPEFPRPDCPEGWTARPGIAPAPLTWCQPDDPPELDCPEGEAPWFATGTCEAVDECPQDAFRDVDGSAVYVRAGAIGGDGSMQAPFGRLDTALAVAGTSTVVLAAGTYALDAVDRAVRIIGRCAADTHLATADASTPLRLSSDGVHLAHLSLERGVVSTASVSLAFVFVPAQGVRAVAGSLSVDRAHIRASGNLVRVETGQMRLRDVTVEGGAAFECRRDATLVLRRTWGRGGAGAGLVADSCRLVDAEEILLEQAPTGVRVLGDTAQVVLRDIWLRQLQGTGIHMAREEASAGFPATVVRIERAAFDGVNTGIEADGGHDMQIDGVFAQDIGRWILSAETIDGAPFDLEVRRVWGRDTGGLASVKRREFNLGLPSFWIFEDAVMLDNHDADVSPSLEAVLKITDGVRVQARRLYLGGGKRLGLVAWESELALEDLTVEGPLVGYEFRVQADSTASRIAALDIQGIGVSGVTSFVNGGRMAMRDVRIVTAPENRSIAVGVRNGSRFGLEIQDVEVLGPGVAVEANHATRLSRGRLTDCALGLRLSADADLVDFTAGLAIECQRPFEQ